MAPEGAITKQFLYGADLSDLSQLASVYRLSGKENAMK